MRAPIRKLGNSSGVIIPKSMLAEVGIGVGDTVELALEQQRITITPIKRRPREGWADAFAEVSDLSDEDRAWLEFGNDADADLTW